MVDINKILKETLDFLREVTGQIKYHEVIEEYSPSLPFIQGDEEQLKQVFINLIINGSQSMQNRTENSVLTIKTAKAEGDKAEGDKKVLVSIQDNGCGIAPENLDRIFDPFYTTKGNDGTGLGMAVIKEIINKHHGQIHIESQMGEGTRVSVILPVR